MSRTWNRMKDTFQQIQTTLATAQINLMLDMRDQPPFAAEEAVAKQVEAILARHGGDVAKAADAVGKDERAMQQIKAEAGLGETLFRAEMDALREQADAHHAEAMGAMRQLEFRNLSKLTDSYEFADADGNKCKKKQAQQQPLAPSFPLVMALPVGEGDSESAAAAYCDAIPKP